MAVIKGSGGCATAASLSVNVLDWSYEKVHNVVGLPASLCTGGLETGVPGAIGLSGRFSGKIEGTAAICSTTNLAGTVVLQVNTGDTISIPAYYNNISINVSLNEQRCEASFVNNGAWTETWAS